MKKQILTGVIVLGATVGAYAQPQNGTVVFDNADFNSAATLASQKFGMIFTGTHNNPVPLNQDINLELLGGSSAASLQQIAALTFANGLAQGDNTTSGFTGVFYDQSGAIYSIPGVTANHTAFLRIDAWLGNDTTYAAALLDGSPVGSSGIYQSGTGGNIGFGPPLVPISAGDGMPSFLVATPEPTALVLGGLSAAAILILRRKK